MPNNSQTKNNYISSHWHGKLPLAHSFWINLLFISWFIAGIAAYAIYFVASRVSLSFLEAGSENVSLVLMSSLSLNYLIKTAFMTWGAVGTWRSLKIYSSADHSSLARKLIAVSTKVLLAIILLAWVLGIIATTYAVSDLFS